MSSTVPRERTCAAVAPISSMSSRRIAASPVSPNSTPPASGTATPSPVTGFRSSQTRMQSPRRITAAAIGRILPTSPSETRGSALLLCSSGGGSVGRLVRVRVHPIATDLLCSHQDTVPRIDLGDREYERSKLTLVVVTRRLLPDAVGNGFWVIGEASCRLGQRECRTLCLREVARLTPRGDSGDALEGFVGVTELACVNVDTHAAAVDLARAQPDDEVSRHRDGAVRRGVGEPPHRLQGGRDHHHRVLHPCFHRCRSFLRCAESSPVLASATSYRPPPRRAHSL